MKAVLLTLLASVLALQPGAALQCYSCKTQVSNTHCRHVQNCTQNETQCWTERIRAIGFLTIISKGCSSHCVEDWQDYYLGKKNITCCSTDLCNASGAHALQPAIATLVLLVALGGLLLWGPDQLSPPGGPRCRPNQGAPSHLLGLLLGQFYAHVSILCMWSSGAYGSVLPTLLLSFLEKPF
ncbi:prostate stem cell antigen [Cynocephalus volans]|uniref:prostate stem cell antigen n=1 Tax=Cynocephalus volans TaxID=110931 RepID=UPI002FC7D8C8